MLGFVVESHTHISPLLGSLHFTTGLVRVISLDYSFLSFFRILLLLLLLLFFPSSILYLSLLLENL
jgi:hypothetical protein